jgi:para-nitrobenzyl esterase
MKRPLLLFLGASAALACSSSSSTTTPDGGTSAHHDSGHDAPAHADARRGDAGHDASRHDATHVTGDATPKKDAPEGADAGHDGGNECPTAHPGVGPVLAVSEGATCAYEGIPFAAPPTKALRWKPPQPAASWTTPRPSAFASGCPQSSSSFGVASVDEDCLYLNAWVPAVPATPSLPVMVFVHGGSFESGSGSYPLYDGAKLAASTGNVVVTINYRLGALGFLSNPDLRAEDPAKPTSGNYGILDQIAAFQWVHDNIAAFGGDPSNVTIFGESAGALSMLVHLASPLSAGLFQKVMMESTPAPNRAGAAAVAAADAVGASYASALGCNGTGAALLACLRGQSLSDVLSESDSLESGALFSWWPVVDGYVLGDYPMKRVADGSFNKVPTLLGTNKNEATVLLLGMDPTDAASYLAAAEVAFPGNGAAVVAEYPISAYDASYGTAAAVAFTDGAFVCPARQIARAIASTGTPVFRYDFVHAIAFPIPDLGAFHGSELEFVFGNPLDGSVVSLTPAELPLSTAMMGYWGAMASSGNPNGGSRLMWPAYDLTTEPDLVLDLTLSTETELEKATCDFWDALTPGGAG